jgi:hypothetical protein
MSSIGADETGMTTLYPSIQHGKDMRMAQLFEITHLLQKMFLLLLLFKVNGIEHLHHDRLKGGIEKGLGKMDTTR